MPGMVFSVWDRVFRRLAVSPMVVSFFCSVLCAKNEMRQYNFGAWILSGHPRNRCLRGY